MNNIQINAKQDFLQRISSTSSINAVAELIWNSLDAGANKIDVIFDDNGIGGLDRVTIVDDGCGIDVDKVQSLFGNLGDSWKKHTERFNNRPLHGQKGEGRFKAFAIGSCVTWESVYKNSQDGKHYKFTIKGYIDGKSIFTYDAPKECDALTGTKVTITSIAKAHGSLLNDETHNTFTKIFASYLRRFPSINLIIDGSRICPDDHCTIVKLAELTERNGHSATVEVVEWDMKIDRQIQLCDAAGIELQTTEANVRAKGFNFTILIKSNYFRELDQQNLLSLDNFDSNTQAWIDEAREVAKGYFRQKRAEELSGIVQRWKEEQIYPFEDKDPKDITSVELAERQVFDIIGVNVQDFLPEFDKLDSANRKFTFRLLAQALKNNPESLQTILTEVLKLKPEDQKELADLLHKTELTNIIKCAKTVADRLNFIVGLENLLFDKETKKTLLERDQLHKILENEAWIFDENFALAASEATLNEVLNLHLDKLGKMCDDDSTVTREDGQEGRVDLLLGLATRPRHDELDHLVVELKRPSQKITTEVLDQARSYALAIAGDPRFDKTKTNWKVIAVSNEMNEEAEECVNQANHPVGLYHKSKNGNIEVWAFTWTQILSAARAKLEFLNKNLCYDADRESAKKYLLDKHEKYIPKVTKDMTDSDTGENSNNSGEVENDSDR